ncbi:MAG: DUF3662 and FHA domain-containing protein [Actinobacteria bacterium]|nr:DUF3662 and FHA domain-containing protein [Actinomycetota bacterium]
MTVGVLRRFEKRLEKAFEGPFTRAFKGGVHPLEIARRLAREMDDGRAIGVSETLAPNRFQVSLSPADHERLAGALEEVRGELETLLISYANERAYHLVTRPRVDLVADASLREGEFTVSSRLEEGRGERRAASPAAYRPPEYEEGRLGVLTVLSGEQAGLRFFLKAEKIRVGRAEGNDLRLPDPRASRFHAEIERIPEGYVVRDLGSTNGTLVGGRRVAERLLEEGDVLTVGGTEMRFDLVADG